MLTSSLLASLHYLTLPLGLGGLWMRGRYLRSLLKGPNQLDLQRLFIADNCWGVAALLWLATGLFRAFGGIEKGSSFYLHSSLFWLKIGLFGAVAFLEILPMVTFIRWRIQSKRAEGHSFQKPVPSVDKRLRLINDLEVALVLLIPFVASAMARGLG